ncbi:MAG: hypothetical protein ABI193_01370 [Minicystis sp.]
MNAARKLDATPPFADDPVLAAFLRAPVSAEVETDEERAAFELGMADIRAGRARAIDFEEMRATLEGMRRDQGE